MNGVTSSNPNPSFSASIEHSSSEIPKHVVENIRKHIGSLPNGPMPRLSMAYSNVVYMFSVGKNRYIYKELKDFDAQDEMINNMVASERVIVSTNKFRIERYLDSEHSIIKRDLKEIATELRRFHNIKASGIRSYKELVNNMMYKCIKEILPGEENNANPRDVIEKIKSLNQKSYKKDKDHIVRLLIEVQNRVFRVSTGDFESVTCHNDLQPGNILMVKTGVVFIDFEFVAMGSPVIDIANLFCEAAYDYENYVFQEENFPNTQERLEFIGEYMDSNEHLEKMLELVEGAMAYSHFLWYLWALGNSRTGCSKNFDYSRYGNSRLHQLRVCGIINHEEYEILQINKSELVNNTS
ncbi:choline kinase [Encephalitozoon intestinalis]